MGVDYDAKLFYGVEIDSDTYEKACEENRSEPDEIEIENTGNGVCGVDCKIFAVISSEQVGEYYGLDTVVDLNVDKQKELLLIEYAKTLGVEDPKPQWVLGMNIG